MKKKIITLVLTMAMSISTVSYGAEMETDLEFYRELANEIDVIEVIDSFNLSLDNLENRNGKIIIEQCIGIVENENGDGRILNCADPDYSYISYRSVEDIQKGDIILTYCIYNPDTNFVDDVMARFDYVIDRE